MVKVLHEEGEEAFFAAFEDQDIDDYRSLDEDGFVNAMVALAPGTRNRFECDHTRATAVATVC